MLNDPAPGAMLLAQWRRFSRSAAGRWLFNRLLRRMVPYSGTIRPRVEVLEPGFARVALNDGRIVRNHLRSIHAVALVNLGELASGLAMVSSLPPGIRSIVTGLEAEFLRKARGRLVAECAYQPPRGITAPREEMVEADIQDASGETVARVRVTWRLAPE